MQPVRNLKELLRRSDWLRRKWRNWQYHRAVRRLRGPRILRKFAGLYPHACFIQIGANDGDQLDPLRSALLSHPWRGIMVEPVPFVFERLRHNCGSFLDRVHLENVAISRKNGSQPFWHLREARSDEGLPRLYDALGSFHREIVLKHRDFIPDIEERLICTEIPCITFDELCRKHGIGAEEIDLIQIDTEGYDFEIIQSIDFDRCRPVILIYEHHHLDEEARQACQRHLGEYGYEFFEEGLDTWCFHAGANSKKLTRYWRKLVPAQTD